MIVKESQQADASNADSSWKTQGYKNKQYASNAQSEFAATTNQVVKSVAAEQINVVLSFSQDLYVLKANLERAASIRN